jgi:hypothetical protein
LLVAAKTIYFKNKKLRTYLISVKMVKEYFLIIASLLSTTFYATAQEYQYVPFPDSNAVWSEVYWKPYGEPAPLWVFNKYAIFNEDTVINDIVYHKLYHTNASEITQKKSECFAGLREDGMKRIWMNKFVKTHEEQFVANEYGENLLYDFSLNKGDTLVAFTNHLATLKANEYLVVTKVDSIKIYSSIRKVINFNISWTYWIEGIGNVKGLIFNSGDLPNNGIDNDLICMHQNDTLMYYNSGGGYYDDCVPQFVKDGVALLPNTEVKVFPNPATGGLVNFEGLDFETLELFDLNGSLIREEKIRGEECFQLDVSNLPPGVYTYRLKTNGLVPTMGKIVVQ